MFAVCGYLSPCVGMAGASGPTFASGCAGKNQGPSLSLARTVVRAHVLFRRTRVRARRRRRRLRVVQARVTGSPAETPAGRARRMRDVMPGVECVDLRVGRDRCGPNSCACARARSTPARRDEACRIVGPMVTIEWYEGPCAALGDLFALADDSLAAVRAYRDLGRVLVARDGSVVIGNLQLIAGERSDEAEVKSVAVREDRQGAGVGRMLLKRAAAVCREEGRSTLLVATAAADTRVLRFYQLLGFRLLRVERDVFTPEAGYPEIDVDGVPLRDQVWLSLALQRRGDHEAPPAPLADPDGFRLVGKRPRPG